MAKRNVRTVNCRHHGYKAKIVIGADGDYKGIVYVQRDPAQGRAWKCITACPHSVSKAILEFCASIEDAVRYVANS